MICRRPRFEGSRYQVWKAVRPAHPALSWEVITPAGKLLRAVPTWREAMGLVEVHAALSHAQLVQEVGP